MYIVHAITKTAEITQQDGFLGGHEWILKGCDATSDAGNASLKLGDL